MRRRSSTWRPFAGPTAACGALIAAPGTAQSAHYRIKPRTATSRRKLWKRFSCRKQFTVTVGTIFEDSKIPLNKWLLAFYLLPRVRLIFRSPHGRRTIIVPAPG
jgi:transposase-like protein